MGSHGLVLISMDNSKSILQSAAKAIERVSTDDRLCEKLDRASKLVADTLGDGKIILAAGNGGSATDANHLAEELIGRFKDDRISLPAICLNVDGAAMSCIANDYGWENVFSRQVEGYRKTAGCLVAISTSGNSPNILKAIETSKRFNITTIGFLGRDGGAAAKLVDIPLIVPHDATERIQEVHTVFLHAICSAVEDRFRQD